MAQCVDITRLIENDKETERSGEGVVTLNDSVLSVSACSTAIDVTVTTGKKKKSIPARKSKAMDPMYIRAQLLDDDNCDKSCVFKCNDQFNEKDQGEKLIMQWRQKIHSHSMGPKQQLALIDLIRNTRFKPKDHRYYCHVVEGSVVCRKFFYKVLMKVCYTTYARALRMVKQGKHFIERSKSKDVSGRGFRGAIAKGFMSDFVNRLGDPSPETQRILMPVCISVQQIYNEYAEKFGKTAISTKRFYFIWKKNFSHVSFPKYCKVAGCDLCMLARELISKEPDARIRDSLIKDRNAHLAQQQAEREAYYTRRASAVCAPKQKMSVIVDGMDQAKTNLPHYKGWKQPKSAVHSLRTHITGVIVHGKKTHFYLDLLQWPHDSNMMLNCVLDAVLAYRDEQNRLPPILYVQCDNCGRENKNKFVIAMLALLVKRGFIKEVILSFLMKGHTHEDIDQRFSKVSHALQRYDAKSIEELLEVMRCSLRQQPKPVMLGTIFDIRNWLNPYLQPLHQHSHPHVFRIFKDTDDHVAVRYKMWSTDEDWLPSPETALEIFKIGPDGLQQIPAGKPDKVTPRFEKTDFPAFRNAVENQKAHLNFQQYNCFQKFIQAPETEVARIVEKYPGTSTEWFLDLLDICADEREAPLTTAVTEGTPLSLLRNKETHCPQVYSGTIQKKSKTKHNAQSNEAVAQESRVIKKSAPAVGFMIIYTAKNNQKGVKVGEVEEIQKNGQQLKIKCFSGKLNSQWKPHLKPNGTFKHVIIDTQRLICPFHLTPTLRLPAFVSKKIRDLKGTTL